MNQNIKAIAAGLKAAAKSLVTTHTRFSAGNVAIRCPLCGHDEFDTSPMLMSTSGATFIGMDWANRSATALICQRCSRIELFAKAPTPIDAGS